jgi:hypothetical protein
MNQLFRSVRVKSKQRGRSGRATGSVPVGEVAGGASEAAEKLLEFAEGGVAGEVGGWVAARAAAGELRLVAVEHGALVPARHSCGAGERGMRVRRRGRGRGVGRRRWDGVGCGGKGVIEEGFGGNTAELLAGGVDLLVAAGRLAWLADEGLASITGLSFHSWAGSINYHVIFWRFI